MVEGELMLGETEVSEDEIRRQVDRETAISMLADADADMPQERIDEYIRAIPVALSWLEEHGRDFPWRRTKDPWKIYIAEILLQRTRASTVAGMYPGFLDEFPTPKSLHATDEVKIREHIKQLGFVNHRTRTLQEVAKLCSQEHENTVPDSLDALMQPWRVGPYVARAVQLFARDEPLALVDANIARVIHEMTTYPLPPQPHKSDRFYRFCQSFVPFEPEIGRSINFSLIDLGSIVFKPGRHNYSACPFHINFSFCK